MWHFEIHGFESLHKFLPWQLPRESFVQEGWVIPKTSYIGKILDLEIFAMIVPIFCTNKGEAWRVVNIKHHHDRLINWTKSHSLIQTIDPSKVIKTLPIYLRQGCLESKPSLFCFVAFAWNSINLNVKQKHRAESVLTVTVTEVINCLKVEYFLV